MYVPTLAPRISWIQKLPADLSTEPSPDQQLPSPSPWCSIRSRTTRSQGVLVVKPPSVVYFPALPSASILAFSPIMPSDHLEALYPNFSWAMALDLAGSLRAALRVEEALVTYWEEGERKRKREGEE